MPKFEPLILYLPDSKPWPPKDTKTYRPRDNLGWKPEDRCRSRRSNGERCRALVRTPIGLCRWHGTAFMRGKTNRIGRFRNGNDMAVRFFSKALGPTLAEAMDSHLENPVNEQLELFEELFVAKTMEFDAMVSWRTARDLFQQLEAHADKIDPKILESARLKVEMAAMQLKESQSFVKELAESCTRICAAAREKISIHSIQAITSQITRCAYEAFAHDPRAAERFEQLVREKVRLPTDAQGTNVLPSDDVAAMDDSIPKGPGDDDSGDNGM